MSCLPPNPTSPIKRGKDFKSLTVLPSFRRSAKNLKNLVRKKNRGTDLTDANRTPKDEYLTKFQKILVAFLAWIMALVVLLATVDLIYVLAMDLISPPIGRLDISELMSIFADILLVLMGVELLETFKAYQLHNTINVQMVLLVALTAMSRKIIILELNENSNDTNLLGIAAIVIAFSAGYYLVRKGRSEEEESA